MSRTTGGRTLGRLVVAAGCAGFFSAAQAGVLVTGGERSLFNGEYAVHTFTNSGALTVTQPVEVEVLLVGGGGGGGASSTGGGGGGGGGFVTNTIQLAAGTYQIVVGEGGTGGVATGANASDPITQPMNGGDSKIVPEGADALLVALGGGAGGSASLVGNKGEEAETVGKDGGCGGGGAVRYISNAYQQVLGGAGIQGQGFGGGAATNGAAGGDWKQGHIHCWAGGGGGAGAAGEDGACTNEAGKTSLTLGVPGVGGDGAYCDITGVRECYAGGGGGGAADYSYNVDKTQVPAGTVNGGAGGGGAGSINANNNTANAGLPGTDGKGGGGGGGGSFGNNVGAGGKGGNGIVVIRYRLSAADFAEKFKTVETEGAVMTKNKGYRVYTFSGNGSFKVTGDAVAEVLLVGGGGGGGAASTGGGGGGGGGFVHREVVAIPAGEYAVVVGAGGAGASGEGGATSDGTVIVPAQNGGASSVFGIIAQGGGAGGSNATIGQKDADTSSDRGKDGASGGGATHRYFLTTEHESLPGGAAIAGQGFPGGCSTNALGTAGKQGHVRCWAGGGGGAGAPGADAVATSSTSGAAGVGGDGLPCSITGSEVYYAGGGGGGFADYSFQKEGGTVAGGNGGGGAGSGCNTTSAQYPGENGEDGKGGGGGGGGGFAAAAQPGGKGGDGVVIIRCKVDTGLLLLFR